VTPPKKCYNKTTLSRYIFSKANALAQVSWWRTHLPTVAPHYAVKCNNDAKLLSWLANAGVQFDCASPGEMHQVLAAGAKPTDIIYAHPCKSSGDIRVARDLGIRTTVVDSPEEAVKLGQSGWNQSTLIRLMVPDGGSKQPFSKKFGAPLSWVPEIYDALRQYGVRLSGWSFHVGSMCTEPQQFSTAIELCAEAQAMIPTEGPITVDIGGGFIPNVFEAAASEIRSSFRHFPPDTEWIAEPGRFIATPVITMHVPIIGVKRRIGGGFRYTVDEYLYGAFSNIPFDGQKPEFELIDPAGHRPLVRATIFGRTCDSADCLAEDIELPELRVGDWLRVSNMGAYTLVSSSEFNGFPLAKRIYE